MTLNKFIRLRKLRREVDCHNRNRSYDILPKSKVSDMIIQDYENTLKKNPEYNRLFGNIGKVSEELLAANPCSCQLTLLTESDRDSIEETSPRIVKLFQEFCFNNLVKEISREKGR